MVHTVDKLFIITHEGHYANELVFTTRKQASTYRDKNWDRKTIREDQIEVVTLKEFLENEITR